ncbi:hypothetical protein [uncultured Psychroserpens sp.]|uniref:hypothetical protein n=1 Tax=uncultured Psychroserpens sp. TaxID=255436 RepID=UPI002608756F|nr:hypothetical protein [uncultured Psychroserpens sp.]
MKHLIVILLITISSFQAKQEQNLNNWIKEVINDLVELNDLDKYSNRAVSPNIEVNFVLVQSTKDIIIKDDIITMLINNGKGTYCTQLKFRYTQKDGQFYLVFPEPYKTTILGQERLFINPWIEKTNICD